MTQGARSWGLRLGALAAGCTAVVDLSAVAPAGATGVALDVVAVDAQGVGYVTVHPCGSARPLASNLNPQGPDAVANTVVLPVDPARLRAHVDARIQRGLEEAVTAARLGGTSFDALRQSLENAWGAVENQKEREGEV